MNLLVAAMLDLLLLIPSPEANEKHSHFLLTTFSIKANVSVTLEYEDQMDTGELLSVYLRLKNVSKSWITKVGNTSS